MPIQWCQLLDFYSCHMHDSELVRAVLQRCVANIRRDQQQFMVKKKSVFHLKYRLGIFVFLDFSFQ